MGTSTALDAVLLAVLLSVGIAAWLAGWLARELGPVRPPLPAEDCPPASASRLVPVGAQLEHEVRCGLAALEEWLLDARRR